MNAYDIEKLVEKQKRFFQSGITSDVKFRTEGLKKLYASIVKYEKEIKLSLKEDLGKSGYESFMCEIGLVLSEISYLIKHIKRFSAKKRVRTSLSQLPSKCYTKNVPYGNVLIMSPWNYPFLLTMQPLATSISAGNVSIIKPSAYAPQTCKIIEKIISESFPEEYVYVILGGRAENTALLDRKFDFIFFTGSMAVGKEVLRRSCENLTPTVLELGGKSPCIIDGTADIKLAAKRIVFGKYLNCGQTCVAPDYILCQSSVKERFTEEAKREIELQYGKRPLKNENYGKIINKKHFERIVSLIDKEKVVFGAETDEENFKISPTVMDNVTWEDPVMKEEIFGPVMPILTFDNFDEMISKLKEKPHPLALYLFSYDRAHIKKAENELSYGGGCVNDTIIQLATSNMGFGGVGESGMGAYHGKVGFEAFSHKKSIVQNKSHFDLPMRYQPYKSKFYEKLLHRFLK